MRKLVTLSLLFAAGLMLSGYYFSVPTSGQKAKLVHSENAIANQYIVVLNDDYVGRDASAPEVEATAQFLSSVYGGEIRSIYSNALKGYSGTMTPEQAEALSREERVRFVEEDATVSASEVQANAPWNLDRVDQRNLPMDTNFGYMQTGSGAHVYVIDTGIRVTHQEFGGRASVVFDAVNDGQNGNDCNGHGTHVAGTAVGATYGVAKNAYVHSVRVLNCSAQGQISNIVAAIDWITANRVNPAVVNISITAAGSSPSMEEAVTNSFASGVVYAISAGNGNNNACNYSPGRTPAAITVGGSAQGDEKALFSNYGSCVDLFAPGYEIVSAGIASDSALAMKSGTSMAAPLVAGVIAVYRAANPSANATAVTQALNSGVTTGVITNLDPNSPNKLLYSWLGSSPAPTPTATPTPTVTPTPTATPAPSPTSNGRINVRKRVQSSTGTSSTAIFPYQATNLPTSNFTLVNNQEFSDSNVQAGAQTVSVTEASVAGMQLIGVECVESGGETVPNTTVDLANRRANIVVEGGETVTCTFTSEELVPTAGDATVAGRVIDSHGRGVKGVLLTLMKATTGEVVTAMTSNMGYYSFDDVEVSNFYVLTAHDSKRYTIANNVRSFTVSESLVDVDFFAERE